MLYSKYQFLYAGFVLDLNTCRTTHELGHFTFKTHLCLSVFDFVFTNWTFGNIYLLN